MTSLIESTGYNHVCYHQSREFDSAVPCIEHVLHPSCLGDVAGDATNVVAGLSECICHLASQEPIDTFDKYERPKWNNQMPAISFAKLCGYTDALATDMEVVEGYQAMRTVTVVGAVRLMRLELHHFGFFGVGEACIDWTRTTCPID